MRFSTSCDKMEVKKSPYGDRNNNEIFASKLSYIHNIGKIPLQYVTIGQQLSVIACEDGDREAFVFVEENKRFTYKQLLSDADDLAAGLNCLGLQQGDRLGLLAPNVSTWPVVMYAAARAGLILVCINPTFEAEEITNCLTKVSVKVLVTSENFGAIKYNEKLLEIIPQLATCDPKALRINKLPDLTTIIVDSETNYAGTLRLKDVVALSKNFHVNIEEQQGKISPDMGCNIQFTSGFTGTPKAVLNSHFGLINNGFQFGRCELVHTRMCMPLPFCHIFALDISMAALCNRGTVIVPSPMYDPEKNLRAIGTEKCNIIFGVPTMFQDLMLMQRKLKLDLKNIIGITGAALCSPAVFDQVKQELGLKRLMMAYGLTEHCGISFVSYPEDTDELIMDTVGHVVENIEVKVINDNGHLVPFGTPGQLCIRGYLTMNCYWGDEKKTREILGIDGWLQTGDYFVLESSGYGKIIGRIAEIIAKGKERIFPRDIENLLTMCPQIAEAYVVGVPDEVYGEDLCAFVSLRNGCEKFSLEDIHAFCNGKIAQSHIPRYLQIVKKFPKTLAGKIKKAELKKQFMSI